MCGIAGIVGDPDKKLLKKMCDIMQHRGPDDSGYFLDKNVGLGNRRLSIIDVKGGKMPIHNEEGNIWITFNGEIYNYKDWMDNLESGGHKFYTRTDTETIIHLYEKFGEKCVSKLRGMFVFAIWDSEKKKLFIARDRLGIKPLYYSQTKNSFIFGSEIKSLLMHPEMKREIDMQALYYFLIFRYVPSPLTLFKNIKKLPPGHTLSLDGKLKVKNYWSIESKPERVYSDNYYIKKSKELFQESVKMRLMSEVPLGAYLSGGLDSTAVVGMMSQLMDEPVKTFSVGFEDSRADETNYSRLVAEHFGTDHHQFITKEKDIKLLPLITWYADEPLLADPACIPTYQLSRLSKKYVTVILSGDGGDEIFIGYEINKIVALLEKYLKFVPKNVKDKIVWRIPVMMPVKILDRFFSFSSSLGPRGIKRSGDLIKNFENNGEDAYISMMGVFDKEETSDILKTKFDTKISEKYFLSNKNLFNQVVDFEIGVKLPEDYLTMKDKMTMAESIELRVPLLDHELVDFSMKIPNKLKLQYGKEKYVLREMMKSYSPKKIVNREKKRWFVPIDSWFEGELKEIFNQYYSQENVKRMGFFDYQYIQHILDGFEKSKLYCGRQLWNLLIFELWRKTFIERENIGKPLKSI
jgi:asparagine synthase (glutamine-hydrolysing)